MERQSGVSPLSVPFSPWKDVEWNDLFPLAALRTLASPLLIRETQSAAASGCTWSVACLGMWELGTVSVTFLWQPRPPPPPPLAPLCSRLSSCPVRSSSAVKPFSMAGAAGVFQVTSFNQPPPLQWAHRSGFPSHSAADPQEALLTQGSGGENGHCPELVWSLGGGEEGPRLTVGPEVASVIPTHAVHWPELASRSHRTSRGRGVRPSLCLGWARTGHVGWLH